MDLELRGRTALVTGGSRGIGRGIAEALLAERAEVAICARGADELERSAAELRSQAPVGSRVVAARADLTQEGDRERVVSETLEGLGRIDILVNNAGRVREEGEASAPVWVRHSTAQGPGPPGPPRPRSRHHLQEEQRQEAQEEHGGRHRRLRALLALVRREKQLLRDEIQQGRAGEGQDGRHRRPGQLVREQGPPDCAGREQEAGSGRE